MTQHDDFDRSLARWFDAEAHPAATADVLDRALRATRPRRPYPRLFAALGSRWVGDSVGPAAGGATLRRTDLRASMALLLLLLVLILTAGAVLVGARLLQPAPAVDRLGIFAPVAGRVVYGDENGIWGVDADAPAGPSTKVQLTSEPGIPLGWSSDGTRLLIMRGNTPEAQLFVLHADGSETNVSELPMTIAGATISPDGSRVVFAGATGTGSALYAVNADGGSAEVIAGPQGDSIRAPTYSRDGTQIAYTFGSGDHSHHVWVIGTDGSHPHEIVFNETTAEPGHVRGLAWSPAGDRIALALGGTIYTFAPDGSDFTEIAGGDTTCDLAYSCAVNLPKAVESPYWSPDGSRIAYTTGCNEGAGAANRDGCILAIADADGSNRREFSYGMSGPWHPGKLAVAPSPTVEPTAGPSQDPNVTALLNAFVRARVDGSGAGNFVTNPSDAVPLLYATSSGAAYERGEFEQVPGIEWPFGWTAFKVRLFAGDTVVEQLFFASPGPGALHYEYDGFRTDIPPTTENGRPVGVPSTYFDGEVTIQAVHPWVDSQLIPEGAGPTTDGGERNGWRRLIVKAVPANCQPGRPANAEGVAESIRSDPDLEVTPPVAVSAGGANALMMDVVTAAGKTACGFNFRTGERTRLYLIDTPDGSSMRVLAIAISVPEALFARAVAPAAAMVESIEFHAP